MFEIKCTKVAGDTAGFFHFVDGKDLWSLSVDVDHDHDDASVCFDRTQAYALHAWLHEELGLGVNGRQGGHPADWKAPRRIPPLGTDLSWDVV